MYKTFHKKKAKKCKELYKCIIFLYSRVNERPNRLIVGSKIPNNSNICKSNRSICKATHKNQFEVKIL